MVIEISAITTEVCGRGCGRVGCGCGRVGRGRGVMVCVKGLGHTLYIIGLSHVLGLNICHLPKRFIDMVDRHR